MSTEALVSLLELPSCNWPLRLRYQFGSTADLTRAAGGNASQARLVFDIRRLFR